MQYRLYSEELQVIREHDAVIYEKCYVGPSVLKSILFDWSIFHRAKSVAVEYPTRNDIDEHFFRDLPCLQYLTLTTDKMNDQDLSHIKEAHQLRALDITGEKFSDKITTYIRPCVNLEHLSFFQFHMSGEAIENIAKMPHIRRVDLQDCTFDNPDDLSSLLESQSIKVINLQFTGLDNATITKLQSDNPDVVIEW